MKTLRPILPNETHRIAYQRRLERQIDAMTASFERWVIAAYRRNVPEVAIVAQVPVNLQGPFAADASPSRTLQALVSRLARRWQKRFNELAPKLGEYFATAASERVEAQLKTMLRDAGFTVRFKLSKAQNDILQGSIAENVGLIRSIPSEYATRIQGAVMRAVTAGRDLASLNADLRAIGGVTRRRASLIAHDQTNKMTAMFARSRQLELGITKATWRHSRGGHIPRPAHVAFSGQTYDVAKGVVLDEREGVVWPGTAIRCRCVSIPVIEGFDLPGD